jgi:alginate O-acetyltransferase complex protein AlgI
MVLGGLWHGASWNFVIWGSIHGFMLGLERFHGKNGPFHRLPSFIQVACTFLLVTFSWVFFRSSDFSSAIDYCRSMAGIGAHIPSSSLIAGVIYQPYYLGSFLLAGVVIWTAPQTWDWTRSLTVGKAIVILILFWISVIVMTGQSYNPFIYFNF